MIQVTPHMRTYIAIEPVDFRCQIDGLSYISKTIFQEDPKSGCVFVFKNRSETALKLLFYDQHAFWLCHMRLSSGKIKWWPKGDGLSQGRAIDAHELMVLIWNGDPRGVFQRPWRQLDIAKWQGDGKEEKGPHS